MDENNPLEWRGAEVVDRDGDKVGTLAEVYLDAETRRPEWAIVKVGLFGRGNTFVPLAGADREGDIVRVRYDKGQIKDAPDADPDGELSVDEEERLYRHYGLERSEAAADESGAGQPERRVRLVRYVVEEVPVDAGRTGETREENR